MTSANIPTMSASAGENPPPPSSTNAAPTSTIVPPSESAPPAAPFSAVVDIEDIHYVSICGIRRRRPAIVPYLCPFRRHLEVGKMYRYCTCGRSKDQPWCDESHNHTDPEPIEFTVDVEQTWHLLCACKYSLKQPFCDGSHIHAVDGYEEVAAAATNATSTTEGAKPNK